MKFYAGNGDYSGEDAANLTPLLRAYQEYSAEGLPAGVLPTRVWNPTEADLVILPRVWSYYATQGKLAESMTIAAEADRAGKSVLIWHTGDLNPIVPFRNHFVLANAVERSTRRKNWYVAPRFIEDPLPTFSQGRLVVREKASRPVVGFCGYASITLIKLTYSILYNLKFRAEYALGRSLYEPPPIIPATVLRAKALKKLASDHRVETSFVIRSRYKAGAYRADRSHQTVVDYYNNLLGTDYTVCVRGYGNWSVRLYETLACGRIPIFIDTDCTLPFDRTIDWKRYCVWVPESDVKHASDYVIKFHDRLSSADFRALQQECRNLWETRLTLRGFLSHLEDYWGEPTLRNSALSRKQEEERRTNSL